MRPHPSVGTVVPSHMARYLPHALASLLSQTAPHEIVVVDDGSPDAEVSRVARDFGLRCVRNSSREGPEVARNVGIEALPHPWILNFDMDNIAEPRLVERLLRAALRRDRTGIAYCRAVQFDEGGGPYWPVRRGQPWHLKVENFIDATSMFSREAWNQAGGWDPKAAPLSDWDLWLGIAERGWRLAFEPRYLFQYRVRSGGGRLASTEERMERGREYIRAKHADFIARRHAAGARNLLPRIANRVRTRLDARILPPEDQGPMRVVLIGARRDGQAHIVLDLFREGLPFRAVAFVDETPELWGTQVHGLPVLGSADRIAEARGMGARGAIVCIGDPHARERLGRVARDVGLVLPTLIHPRCYLAPSAEVAQGAYVGVLSVVHTGAKVGPQAWVPPGAHVGHHAVLGECATLSPGVRLAGRARVGRRAFLGVGATVMPDVVIGDDAVVGAGAVVTRDVEAGATVAGVPARELPR